MGGCWRTFRSIKLQDHNKKIDLYELRSCDVRNEAPIVVLYVCIMNQEGLYKLRRCSILGSMQNLITKVSKSAHLISFPFPQRPQVCTIFFNLPLLDIKSHGQQISLDILIGNAKLSIKLPLLYKIWGVSPQALNRITFYPTIS